MVSNSLTMVSGNRCEICGSNLDLVGRVHRCVPKAEIKELASQRGNVTDNKHALTRNRETGKLKLGRPRLGEVRDKPWIAAGMSKATWYRRQRGK
jgi:hypothetical protein